MSIYSDWRTLRFVDCPSCGGHDTCTRDAPGGLEVACGDCGARSTVPFTPELHARFETALLLARIRRGAVR